MNANEFKAWFSGFIENIEDVPNKEQWEKIKEKVNSVQISYGPIQYSFPVYPYQQPFSTNVYCSQIKNDYNEKGDVWAGTPVTLKVEKF